MKCPHCTVEIHEGFARSYLQQGQVRSVEHPGGPPLMWVVDSMICPACKRAIIRLVAVDPNIQTMVHVEVLGYPKDSPSRRAPAEVPSDLAADFNEASEVLPLSPKASAALSRRCVQALLRGQGYTQHDLAKAIDAVLASKSLPSSLADNLDAIRNVGNFAAHPLKDTSSGQVLPVEPHEAEWNMDVLEGLFDFYYVQPSKDAARKAALNLKLSQAGKPPMKQ